jgi:hypothetical protein
MKIKSSKEENFLADLLDAISSPGVLIVTDIEAIDYGALLRVMLSDKRLRTFKLILYTELSY